MFKNKLYLHSSFDKIKESGDSGTITIVGYANTTAKDRHGDIITRDAWDSPEAFKNYANNPIVLAFHDASKPIGKVLEHEVTNKGLKVVAEISKAAGDIYEFVREGILKTFSVGFRVKDADYDEKSDTFFIKALELFEISVVSIPANAGSTFSVKKSFDNEEDYEDFKKAFTKPEVEKEETIIEKTIKASIDEEDLAKLTDSIEKLLDKKSAKAEEDAKAAEAAEAERLKKENERMTEVTTGAEKLYEEVLARFEKRLADETASMKGVVSGLEAELREKAEEIEALRKNKLDFNERNGKDPFTNEEKVKAVLLSKILDMPVRETKYFKDLVTKSGIEHWNATEDWEHLMSSTIEQGTRQRLVVEPLFTRRIQMPTVKYTMPFNPEAGEASWVAVTSYRADNGASSGTARTHQIEDLSITAHKLATKEYIGYEEEADAIIPILPVIQEAIQRRMAKTWDRTLLRGNVGADLGAGLELIDGFVTLSDDVGATRTVTIAGTFAAQTTDPTDAIHAARKKMGRWGLNPADLVLVTNVDFYYNLIDDPDFKTMDKVGTRATLLNGQVGEVWGIPVVVSEQFEAAAATKVAASLVNFDNYLLGNYKTITVERDRQVVEQRNVIISTKRAGLKAIHPLASEASAVNIKYPAT